MDYITIVLILAVIIEAIIIICYSRTKYQGELLIQEDNDKITYRFVLNGDPEKYISLGHVSFKVRDTREKHSQ